MKPDSATIERFVGEQGFWFIEPPPAYLECSICTETLQHPVCCQSGEHTFCRKCLLTWIGRAGSPRCPIDRQDLENPNNLRSAPSLSEIASMHSDSGVLWVSLYANDDDGYERTKSRNAPIVIGCDWTGTTSDWRTHLSIACPKTEGHNHADSLKSHANAIISQAERTSNTVEASDGRSSVSCNPESVLTVRPSRTPYLRRNFARCGPHPSPGKSH